MKAHRSILAGPRVRSAVDWVRTDLDHLLKQLLADVSLHSVFAYLVRGFLEVHRVVQAIGCV